MRFAVNRVFMLMLHLHAPSLGCPVVRRARTRVVEMQVAVTCWQVCMVYVGSVGYVFTISGVSCSGTLEACMEYTLMLHTHAQSGAASSHRGVAVGAEGMIMHWFLA